MALAGAAGAGKSRPDVSLPAGFTAFPGEIFPAPRAWVEKSYPTLTYRDQVDKGGHFARVHAPFQGCGVPT